MEIENIAQEILFIWVQANTPNCGGEDVSVIR